MMMIIPHFKNFRTISNMIGNQYFLSYFEGRGDSLDKKKKKKRTNQNSEKNVF